MLSIGATVGVGVGSGIAGLAIGLTTSLLVFLFWKRGHGGTTDPSYPGAEQVLDLLPPGPLLFEYCQAIYQRNLVPDLPMAMYEHVILQKLWVVFYYISNGTRCLTELPAPRPKLDKNAVIDLVGCAHADQLLQLIESGDGKEALKAAQIIYARAILSRIDPRGDPETTLLPPDVLRLYQTILGHVERNRNKHPSARPTVYKDYWRSMTGINYNNQFDYNSQADIEVPQEDVRRQRARELSVALEEMLHPFTEDGQFSTAMERDILAIAVKGFTLFSQFDTISVNWDDLWAVDARDGQSKLLLYPAFHQKYRSRYAATGELLSRGDDLTELVQLSKPLFE